MELWRRVFPGSKEAKRRIKSVIQNYFKWQIFKEWTDKQEIPQEISSGLDYCETQKTVNTWKISGI